MKFLILFVVLALHKIAWLPKRCETSRLFSAWARFWGFPAGIGKAWQWSRFVLVVLFPTAVTGVGFYYLQGYFWGLPAAVLEILLLFYILSHSSISRELKKYRQDLERGDIQAAYHWAESCLAVPEVSLVNDCDSLNQQVIRAVLYRWFQYFFLMVFWYWLTDVYGLVLAWMTLQYSQHEVSQGKKSAALYWLEWMPVRLLGLSYCLSGNMSSGLPVWRKLFWNIGCGSERVLSMIGRQSLKLDANKRIRMSGYQRASEELDSWQMLHIRSMSVWMVVIAGMTISGWLL
ncbi:MAG: hypothetical protein CMI09_07155 [Oceanospirillaceae bacterium]|nr:hypothetical protein [Oceanospirillaceae bacterium]